MIRWFGLAAFIWGLMACGDRAKQPPASGSVEPTVAAGAASRPDSLGRSQALAPDSSYARVYQPWDGHWKGTFRIYLDPRGQQAKGTQPRITSRAYLDSLPLELSSELKVEQFYRSTTPFYQTVRIIDTYADGREVESRGYNVVRHDSLICVVNKPEEQVVHQGTTPVDSVLIWSRSLRDPTRIEYFYEKVQGDTYSILGWGYYGNDDPELSPRMWFWAEYERVEEGGGLQEE
jgi:hypothetical protein